MAAIDQSQASMELYVALAVDILARRIAWANLCDSERIGEGWEEYPLVGSGHWQRVVVAVDALADQMNPDAATFEAAYAYLSSLADGAEA